MKYFRQIEPGLTTTRSNIRNLLLESKGNSLVWWHDNETDGYYIGYDNQIDIDDYLDKLSTKTNDRWATSNQHEWIPELWNHVKIFNIMKCG